MIKSSDLSWIVVSDIKKAREFFTKIIGMKEYSFSEDYGWLELEGTSGKGARIGVCQENNEMPAGKNAVITLTVADLEKSRKEFQTKGVKLIGDVMEVPGHCKLQMFEYDGNMLQLVQLLEVSHSCCSC